jgi:signal transduction histidine kinase
MTMTRRTRSVLSSVAVLAGGALLVVLIASTGDAAMADTLEVAAIGAGTAVVGCIAGALVLQVLRRRALATQIAATAMVVLIPVGVGAWVAAQAMFLSDHDLTTLGVILVAAGTVGVLAALAVGWRVGQASRALIDVARRIGTGDLDLDDTCGPVPDELARLYDELVAAARRLDESRTREQALDQSRRELVAWVSHDLRTPLAAIRAVTEALEDGIVDDPATIARYHTTLRLEADRLAGLVDDLFELSRTQAGVLQLEFARVSLGDLVSDAIAGAGVVADAKGVHLEGQIVGTAPEVDASPPEVLRALRNVLENAIRHTPSDGTIVVELGTADEHGYVEVRDTGGGIPVADLPRVFDVAFSGDDARTPGGGAGLGLAIARGLAEAHHGELTVRNENGGACFTLRLPLAPPSER